MEFLTNINVDFINKRKMGFIISGAVIIIGLISLTLHRGPNFGIDFRGGAKILAKFNRAVTEPELKAKLATLGYDRATIQIDTARQEATISLGYRPEFETQRAVLPLTSDPGGAGITSLQVSSTAQAIHVFQVGDIVQLVDGDNRIRAEIRDIATEGEATTFHLTEPVGADLTQSASIQMQASVGRILSDALIEGEAGWHALPGGVNVSEVGPSVGKDLKWAALWSVLVSIAILLVYITWRFEFRFSMGAIAALVHDVLITLGIFSLLVKEINLPTVAAFLTIIGYSLNDTIVVFDRIRENAKFLRGVDQLDILNRSINQSLSRTVITSVTTLFVVLVIFFLSSAGEEINTFAFALIVGVIVGTYSSIFIASPIVYIWHLRDQQRQQQTA